MYISIHTLTVVYSIHQLYLIPIVCLYIHTYTNLYTYHICIYRCIDYTKVSKGLKLVPKNETINLTEALELPISCMTSIQTRIQITLNTIKSNICEYIISDKQVSLHRLIVIQVKSLIILTLLYVFLVVTREHSMLIIQRCQVL